MKRNIFKSLLVALCVGFCAIGANAATSLFSDYGQIQNVQNYSTNPFWTPNAPYNQRLPQPVYVQGADLNADDCFRIVQSLVSAQCIARDNCKDTTLADIRPTIMVQLSNLPGNNYVSACSGFIDGVFESYVAQYGTNVPNRAVGFPTATAPNPNLNNDDNIQIQNPYKQTVPQWKQEIIERSNELQQLQQQNGAGSQQLSATDFPMTFDDLSFEERTALKSADYEQYKDMAAYVVPDFKDIKEWCEGKGAGTAECKTYREQIAQNTQGKRNKPSTDSSGKNERTTPSETKYLVFARLRGSVLPGYYTQKGRPATKSGDKCFAVCDEKTEDDLNTKVLKSILNGKSYCARKSDGMLVEHENRENILQITEQQKEKIKQQIKTSVSDKDNCDWGGHDKVLIFGIPDSKDDFMVMDEVLLDD